MKNNIVLGTPAVDQTKVYLTGFLIVKEDYSVEIIPYGDELDHLDIKNACQIGISRE